VSEITKDFTDGEFAASTVINQLSTVCYARAKEKGFWSDQDRLLDLLTKLGETGLVNVVNIAFTSQKNDLMHSELGEATEAQRKDLSSDKIPGFTGEEEEYADLIIRCFDLAGRKKMRLGEAIILKMRYNEGREYMHGKKF